jgi:ABC-type phosphate transport system substrate-binding protein
MPLSSTKTIAPGEDELRIAGSTNVYNYEESLGVKMKKKHTG